MKNFRFVVVLLVLVIAEGAFADEKSTTEVKQCSANKTEVTYSPPPSTTYKSVSFNPISDISTSLSSDVDNAIVKCIPDPKKE